MKWNRHILLLTLFSFLIGELGHACLNSNHNFASEAQIQSEVSERGNSIFDSSLDSMNAASSNKAPSPISNNTEEKTSEGEEDDEDSMHLFIKSKKVFHNKTKHSSIHPDALSHITSAQLRPPRRSFL